MTYDLREMKLAESRSMIRYFLSADADFLIGMGVDKGRLPNENQWFELLSEDFARPIQQRQFYYLVWSKNDIPIGHCNINKIEFRRSAFMHLHIWQDENRRGGCVTNLLKPSIKRFFEQFELQELYCEPYAKNPGPNHSLPKAGFQFVKTHETTPGWINYHQPVNRWVLGREQALQAEADNRSESLNESTSTEYIHGTSPDEQARLAALNRLTNDQFVSFLDIQPKMRVLEVGSGIGVLANDVAAAAPEVSVVGVERSQKQIDAARPALGVKFVRGNAHNLDFPDSFFDLTYSRFLLEHLCDPVSALKEMRRVTRRNGRVASCENDISLVRLDPPCPAFEQVWERFQTYQRHLGGNAHVGRSLYRLFFEAGFQNVQLTMQPEIHWQGTKEFGTWIENLVGNIRGAQQRLVNVGICDESTVNSAIRELESLSNNPNASSWFAWNRAVAVR